MPDKNSFICGDATEELSRIDDNFVDLIVTDIPYGINYKSNKQNANYRSGSLVVKDRLEFFSKINGDDELPVSWLLDAHRVLKERSAIYIFTHWSKWHELYPAVAAVGFTVKNMIVVNKSNHGMGDLKGGYAPKHELILFATKGRHILRWPNGRGKDVYDGKVLFSGSIRKHPNQKPEDWLVPLILNSSDEGDLILDPFAGCGSTGLAAKSVNRDYLLIDNDIQYVKAFEME